MFHINIMPKKLKILYFKVIFNSINQTYKMRSVIVFITLLGLAFCGSLSLKHKRAIEDDIFKFINNLPLGKVADLVEEYQNNDAEFQAFTAYVSGDEFQTFINNVAATQEVSDVISYLKEKGVITTVQRLAQIHRSLGKLRTARATPGHRSLDQFLDDFEALIPIEEEQALLQDELQNNEEFKNFYDTVTSAEFLDLINKVANLDIVQEQVKKLEDLGVDFQHVLKIDKEIFGIPVEA